MTVVRPTSEPQRRAFSRGEIPPIEEVREGVWSVAMPMGDHRLPYSFCTVIDGGDGAVHLIDTGVDDATTRESLETALRGLGRRLVDVASVTLTHLHGDHAALAQWVRGISGASVRMHRADATAHISRAALASAPVLDAVLAGAPRDMADQLRDIGSRPANRAFPLTVDEVLVGGERLRFGERRASVLRVPGHTRGSIALLLDDDLICTGDHVLPVINPGVGLGGRAAGDNPLDDYLRSLEVMSDVAERYPSIEVIPGHGYRFTGLGARCDELRAHHAKRSAEVGAVIAADPESTVWDVASRLRWTGGWEHLDDFPRFSALAQTQMHLDRLN